MSTTPQRAVSPSLAVVLGGVAAGVIDITYACTFWAIKAGVRPTRIFQSVAAGLLGRQAAVAGGLQTAALGLALHFFIALTVAFVYYTAARYADTLWRRPWAFGSLYGVAVFGVMHYIVVPLSAAGNGGVAPFDPDCNRFENGIRTSGQGCSAQLDTHIFDYIQSIRPRRFTVVDEERQVVFGNFMFNHPGDITWINVPGQGRREMIGPAKRPFAVDVAEAFRIKDRKIRKVEALMVSLPYGMPSPYVPK